MIVNSDEELQAAMMKEIQLTLARINKKAWELLSVEIAMAYTGAPAMYQRTFMLARTPRTTPTSLSGNSAQFEVYLDTGYTYPSITYHYADGNTTTSKSPSMTDVLNLTNYGTTSSGVGKLHPALMRGGYWERALTKIQNEVNAQLSAAFH